MSCGVKEEEEVVVVNICVEGRGALAYGEGEKSDELDPVTSNGEESEETGTLRA